MRGIYRALSLSLGTILVASALAGCGGSGGAGGKRIVRIGHNQADWGTGMKWKFIPVNFSDPRQTWCS